MKSCLSITSIDLIYVFIFVCMPGRVYAWLDNKCIYNILGPRILRSFHMVTNFVQIKENHFYFFHSPIRFRFIGLLLLISEPHVNRKNSIFACTNYTMYIWFLNFRLLDFLFLFELFFVRVDETNNASKHTHSCVDLHAMMLLLFFLSFEEENKKKKRKKRNKREKEK